MTPDLVLRGPKKRFCEFGHASLTGSVATGAARVRVVDALIGHGMEQG